MSLSEKGWGIRARVEKKNPEWYDIYLEKSEYRSAEVENSKISREEISQEFGYGLRVLSNGRIGFSYGTSLDEVDATIDRAFSTARHRKVLKHFAHPPSIKIAYSRLDEDEGDLAEILLEELDKRTEENEIHLNGSLGWGRVEKAIINPGSEANESAPIYNFSMSATIAQGRGFDMYSCKKSAKLKKWIPEVTERAIEIARSMSGKKEKEVGKKELLIHPYALAQILEYGLMPSIVGDRCHRGESKLRKGLMIREGLAIRDADEGLADWKVDDEACPSTKADIIDGEIKEFLYDLKSSWEWGEKSTGNGVREDFRDEPSIAPRNLYLDLDEKGDVMEDGIYIYDVLGAHTINMETMDFSLGSSICWTIEKGELKPLRPVILSGNVLEMLKNSIRVSKERKEIGGLGGSIVLPHLRTGGVRIG